MTIIITKEQSIPPGGPTFARAQCGPDEVVTGGGIRVEGAGNMINPTDPFSAEANTQPNEWVHSYTNPGPNNAAIEAYAECACKTSGRAIGEH